MTQRGPFQPLLFCDSVILCKPNHSKTNIPQAFERGSSHRDLQAQPPQANPRSWLCFQSHGPFAVGMLRPRRQAGITPRVDPARSRRYSGGEAAGGNRTRWHLFIHRGQAGTAKRINKDIKFKMLYNKAAFPTQYPGDGISPTPCPAPEGKWGQWESDWGWASPWYGGEELLRSRDRLIDVLSPGFSNPFASTTVCSLNALPCPHRRHPRRPRDLLGREI